MATPVFGLPLGRAVPPGATVPIVVEHSINLLAFANPITDLTFFDLPVTSDEVQKLRVAFDEFIPDPSADSPASNASSPNVIASVLLLYFKSLPHPIVPPKLYITFLRLAMVNPLRWRLAQYRVMLAKLPAVCKNILAVLLPYLHDTKLPPEKLGAIFARYLLRPSNDHIPDNQASPAAAVRLVSQLIEHASYVTLAADEPLLSPEELAAPIPAEGQKIEAKVLFDYTPPEGTEGLLVLHKDDKVKLTAAYPEDWLEGQLGDAIGFIPAAYVEVIPATTGARPAAIPAPAPVPAPAPAPAPVPAPAVTPVAATTAAAIPPPPATATATAAVIPPPPAPSATGSQPIQQQQQKPAIAGGVIGGNTSAASKVGMMWMPPPPATADIPPPPAPAGVLPPAGIPPPAGVPPPAGNKPLQQQPQQQPMSPTPATAASPQAKPFKRTDSMADEGSASGAGDGDYSGPSVPANSSMPPRPGKPNQKGKGDNFGSEYKIVVVGSGGVGKSAITISFVQNHFVEEYDPTIEDSYRKQITVDEVPCFLNILDTAGQEEYSAMRDQYMKTGQGFLLVFSLTTRSTFDEVSELRNRILQAKDRDQVPIVLVGNKSDLVKEHQVSLKEAADLGRTFACPFLATSAKLRINVEECFSELVREVRKDAKNAKPTRRTGCVLL